MARVGQGHASVDPSNQQRAARRPCAACCGGAAGDVAWSLRTHSLQARLGQRMHMYVCTTPRQRMRCVRAQWSCDRPGSWRGTTSSEAPNVMQW